MTSTLASRKPCLIFSRYLSTDDRVVLDNIGHKIQIFALDVISTIGFGELFGNIKADDLNIYIKSIEGLAVMKFVTALGLTSFHHWPPIARLLSSKESDRSGFEKITGTARAIIDARFKQSVKRKSAMLSSFDGLAGGEVFIKVMLQIEAESETTATALQCVPLYLTTHPRICSKLRAEIDANMLSGAASDDCVKNMPYLQTVYGKYYAFALLSQIGEGDFRIYTTFRLGRWFSRQDVAFAQTQRYLRTGPYVDDDEQTTMLKYAHPSVGGIGGR